MANYQHAYVTSLNNYLQVNGLYPQDVEIKPLFAQGELEEVISAFDKQASDFDDIVDLREGLQRVHSPFIFSVFGNRVGFKVNVSEYFIRGAGIKHKSK